MKLTQEVISQAFLQSANSEDITIADLLKANDQFNHAVTASIKQASDVWGVCTGIASLLRVVAGAKVALKSAIALGFYAGLKAQELLSQLNKQDVPQTTAPSTSSGIGGSWRWQNPSGPAAMITPELIDATFEPQKDKSGTEITPEERFFVETLHKSKEFHNFAVTAVAFGNNPPQLINFLAMAMYVGFQLGKGECLGAQGGQLIN
jgi:hypothetical protein